MTERDKKAIELEKVLYIASEYALCPEGKAALIAMQPATEADEARAALAKTNAVANLLQKLGSPRYGSAEGAKPAAERAQKGGLLSMGELLRVMRALQNFRELGVWFTSGSDEDIYPLDDLFRQLYPQHALESFIKDNILSESEIADGASDTLYNLRRQIRSTEGLIRERLDAMIKSASYQKYLQDSVVTMRGGRFVVPVKAEFKGEVPGALHDVSASGQTLFIEPSAVVEANAKIMQLKNSEAAEIERILEGLSAQVAALCPGFYYSYAAMVEIDAILAKAKLGLSQNAFMPIINSEYKINLHRARHPLIAKEKAVPIDLKLGEDYDTLIVTGPNTGGKTVTLKTAGLLCAMACCGLLIPTGEGSAVCAFKQILADIGDEQSIEQSLSTFSGHMKNITEILSKAGEGTLVLLDELGAGTDPAEGAALAVAIIEKLRSSGAQLLATTHYAELKMYALETAGVQNASCEFDIETLRPTYKLVVGVPGRSNAFAIGQKLGLPAGVIETAQRHLSAEDKRFETVLAQLDDIKNELSASRAEADSLRNAAAIAVERAKTERDAIIAQGEKELENARAKAKALVEKVENEAYRLMDEMKALQKKENLATAEKTQRARQIANKESYALAALAGQGEALQNTMPPLTSAAVGESVFIAAAGREGVVTKAPDKTGMVEVRTGNVVTKVPLGGLCKPVAGQQKQKLKPVKGKAAGSAGVTRSPAMEINLLGRNVEEAILEADNFIDGAVLAGIQTVYIIHGVGTGALRAGLHGHFKKHKSIKSYRLGRYGEGEAGVTVVELR